MYKLIPRGFFMLKFKKIILGLIASAAAMFLMLCICAAVMIKIGLLSDSISVPAVAIFSAVSAFIGAWLSARTAGERGLLHGSVVSVVLCLAYLIPSLLLSQPIPNVSLLGLRCLPMLIAGSIGGILGVSSGKNKISF